MAPEAGNDRLRKIINKSLTNQEILYMSNEVYKAGWNLIKLYYMIGLPGEKDQDVEDIIDLSVLVAALARARGKKGGRQKMLDKEKTERLYKLYDETNADGSRKYAIKEICEMMGISRSRRECSHSPRIDTSPEVTRILLGSSPRKQWPTVP